MPHYLVCAGGVQDSALLKTATKITKENTTTRNWATVLKLLEMVESGPQKTPNTSTGAGFGLFYFSK